MYNQATSRADTRCDKHTHTHAHAHAQAHARWKSSGRGIGPSQRTVLENTQQTQDKETSAPGGIRTRDPNKRTAAERRLRPRGHRDRSIFYTEVDEESYLIFSCTVFAIYALQKTDDLNKNFCLIFMKTGQANVN